MTGAHDLEPDPPLSPDQRAVTDALTDAEVAAIDEALLSNCTSRWRKLAAVVGFTMNDQFLRNYPGVPDIYCAGRVRRMVEHGLLESSGNLAHMRYSEVRLCSEGGC